MYYLIMNYCNSKLYLYIKIRSQIGFHTGFYIIQHICKIRKVVNHSHWRIGLISCLVIPDGVHGYKLHFKSVMLHLFSVHVVSIKNINTILKLYFSV
jgi:hypothetical protein